MLSGAERRRYHVHRPRPHVAVAQSERRGSLPRVASHASKAGCTEKPVISAHLNVVHSIQLIHNSRQTSVTSYVKQATFVGTFLSNIISLRSVVGATAF